MTTARNSITGNLLKTKAATDSYRGGWDAIFKKSDAEEEITLKDRYQGALVGLAVGDAIGTTVEFLQRDEFEPMTDMVGGGPFGLNPGEWTDDTSMALCLAQSLIQQKGFDPIDQMNRYCNWQNFGYLSSNGRCFDIGNTTAFALNLYQELKGTEPYCGSTHFSASGNGSLMRLVPAVMAAYPDMSKILEYAKNSSRTTHGSPQAVECCVLFADILASVFDGLPKNELLASISCKLSDIRILGIAAGEFLEKSRDDIRGSGFCVDSLEASLWCFFKSNSFDEAVLMAVNLGNDADTTAAITGQIAGAFYGINGIRKDWREKIAMSEYIHKTAEELLQNK